MTTSLNALSLRYWPDPVLRIKCEESPIPVGAVEEMIRIMRENNGYGLSAPQAGLTCRLFVMRDPKDPNKSLIFANPIITAWGSQIYSDNEGCLSVPGPRVSIERPFAIEVEFDVTPEHKPLLGDRLTWHLEGLSARCVQHEIDHLNGIMIFDHIKSKLGQKIFLEKSAKERRRRARLG